jgi:putative pyruvate formate lyase activating enzyme
MKCNICPNKCNINRDVIQGMCHADNNMRICRIAPHYFEEPIISGTNGSGTIFFSGCNMDCEFCQNHLISKAMVGKIYTAEELTLAIKDLEKQGVHNINFVTPTHFSHKIKETLDIYRPKIPIVYNSSGYELASEIVEMNNYVDIYLPDFKYGNNLLAEKFSKRKNYVDYAISSIEEMVKAKPIVIEDNIMQQGVIVRHLVLPGYIDNSKEVLKIFNDHFKGKALISIMSQFIPCYHSTITRTLKPVEYKIILSTMENYGIEEGFIQELSSAKTEFIPNFEV